jgi:hypothetical protein
MPTNYHRRGARGQQRDKPYREALRLELAEMSDGEDLKKLRQIARAHIEAAAAGDMQAIKDLADRLDGKPAQVLEHTEGIQPTTMRKLTYEIVHVTKTQEQIENEDLVVDYHEIRTVNGNGHG